MPLEALPAEFLFRIDVAVVELTRVAPGPHGDRLIMGVGEGRFEGPRLSGKVVPGPGSEWATLRTDGTLRVDVRLVLETDDGARILMLYGGIGVPREGGGMAIQTAPVFETGDERYAWLHHVQAVGLGSTPSGRGVAYDVYQLKPHA
jgi:hypothetical protein